MGMSNFPFHRARAHSFKLLQELIPIGMEILLLLNKFLWEEITNMCHLVTGYGTSQELSEKQKRSTAVGKIICAANPLKGFDGPTHQKGKKSHSQIKGRLK